MGGASKMLPSMGGGGGQWTFSGITHSQKVKIGLPYILVYKSNFLDVKMGPKNRPRLIFGRT